MEVLCILLYLVQCVARNSEFFAWISDYVQRRQSDGLRDIVRNIVVGSSMAGGDESVVQCKKASRT